MTAVLELRNLSRNFGALLAVDDVSLTVATGARHALIGPNGAGKSTLFRLVAGNLAPSSGRVVYEGRDVTRLPEHRRARRGVAQTFQHSSLFLTMSALDNVVLARQRLGGHARRPLPATRRGLDTEATYLLEQMGLGGRGQVPVAALSHGERRQLEVAVALATDTIVLIEHDLDVVFRLASTVTVLNLGSVLTTGSPDEIRASAEVRETYLGTGRREDLFLPAAGGGR